MKSLFIFLVAPLGLLATMINCQAQQETVSHSVANGQGGYDTTTVEKPVPPPPQPRLAMYDWVMDSTNPYIAINDPTKFSHPKPKPEYNHDGLAFEKIGQTVNFETNVIEDSNREWTTTEYQRNVRSGQWHPFVNGEETKYRTLYKIDAAIK